MAAIDPKTPDEVDAYFVDWRANGRLPDSDTISASTWPTVEAGITVASNTFDATTGFTSAWISGGTAGQTYSATNRITTTEGRTLYHTIGVPVEDQ